MAYMWQKQNLDVLIKELSDLVDELETIVNHVSEPDKSGLRRAQSIVQRRKETYEAARNIRELAERESC